MSELFSIRGAITLEENTARCICKKSTRLIYEIIKRNGINARDIISITVSTTADITADYAAKSIRLSAMINDAPLFSVLEPPIERALPMCIRLLVLAVNRGAKKPVHVYLDDAVALRTDLNCVDTPVSQPFGIALDGPSGAGKSTVARLVSGMLNIGYLDTGAMYRTVALSALKNGLDDDFSGIESVLEKSDIRVEFLPDGQHMILDGEDVSSKIRTAEIAARASAVSALKSVRIMLASLQRDVAKAKSFVLDGRDIGTYVLPDAPYKFFITADADERARRRADELAKNGVKTDLETVKKQLIARDDADSGRDFAPLKKAFDAVEIDTTKISAQRCAEIICDCIKIYG